MKTEQELTPAKIVAELDRYVIGQAEAKRAVAVALRNRWRRQQVEGELRDEIAPKNIILIGPTGVGKTDVSREGVQRDLLPIVEGSTVSTKHGPVRTDHILFIAADICVYTNDRLTIEEIEAAG